MEYEECTEQEIKDSVEKVYLEFQKALNNKKDSLTSRYYFIFQLKDVQCYLNLLILDLG